MKTVLKATEKCTQQALRRLHSSAFAVIHPVCPMENRSVWVALGDDTKGRRSVLIERAGGEIGAVCAKLEAPISLPYVCRRQKPMLYPACW